MKKVTVEFAGGEVFKVAPLVALGIIPKPYALPLTGKERFAAHGLEGKFAVEVDEGLAEIIVKKLGKYRSRIVRHKSKGGKV